MANRGGDVMFEAGHVKPIAEECLSHNWGRLTKYTYKLKRRDGAWQEQAREVYDRGNGATCLLHNPKTGTVLLTRQFRLPIFGQDHDGYLIEAPAGLLDGASPADRMRAELEEETGFQVSELTHIYDAFMSPGSVTESLTCFIGTYEDKDQVSSGGGQIEEGEDIEVLHVPLQEALAMMAKHEIRDAKTIMLLQYLALKQAGLV